MKPRNQQTLLGRFNKVMLALVVYTAPLGSVLLTSQADAAVVASGIVNIEISATSRGLFLNVLNGDTNEPGNTAGSTVPGWDINPGAVSGFGLSNAADPAGGTYVTSAANRAANLISGTPINAASTFGSNAPGQTSQWALNSSDNIVGFRFFNEGNSQVHYGWARIEFDAVITSRRLVEYAYEDQAGTAILAAAGSAVPEPTAFALLALGVAGIATRRRRFC